MLMEYVGEPVGIPKDQKVWSWRPRHGDKHDSRVRRGAPVHSSRLTLRSVLAGRPDAAPRSAVRPRAARPASWSGPAGQQPARYSRNPRRCASEPNRCGTGGERVALYSCAAGLRVRTGKLEQAQLRLRSADAAPRRPWQATGSTFATMTWLNKSLSSELGRCADRSNQISSLEGALIASK